MGERSTNKSKIIVHPSHEHPLQFLNGETVSESFRCCGCTRYARSLSTTQDYCICIEEECEYYLHKECADLKDVSQSQMHHPLHPLHPLTLHFNNDNTHFLCSFCEKTNRSGFFCYCDQDQCDFYLDISCFTRFTDEVELLNKFQVQHFLHGSTHHLSPCLIPNDIAQQDSIISYQYHSNESPIAVPKIPCNGCGLETINTPILECTSCPFVLHVPCYQLPIEIQSPLHSEHPLTLDHNKPLAVESKQVVMSCLACEERIEDVFFFHCTIGNFILDLRCSLLKPSTAKLDIHQHHLVHFDKMNLDGFVCSACDSLCNNDLFSCFPCHFNIHSQCVSLPRTVDFDGHIHPLTLTNSFIEDNWGGEYYCDICEQTRDPDLAVYVYRECYFIAHIGCVLPMESSNGKLGGTEYILSKMDAEIGKLGEVVKQMIMRKRLGRQLLKAKMEGFDKKYADVKVILRQLLDEMRSADERTN